MVICVWPITIADEREWPAQRTIHGDERATERQGNKTGSAKAAQERREERVAREFVPNANSRIRL
jgi:hypothetical protein